MTNLSLSDVDVDNADEGLIFGSGSTITNLRTAGIVLDDAWVSDVQQTWIAPTLINSWANLGAPYSTAGYYRTTDGTVRLKGLIGSGAASTTAFVLPVGYRPAQSTYLIAVCAGGSIGQVIVEASGNVNIEVFSSWIALDSISFRADA